MFRLPRYDVNNVPDAMPIMEYLNSGNADNLRPMRRIWDDSPASNPAPIAGNWNAPISYGAPAVGYTDRTSAPELAATLQALQVARTGPANQPPPDPATQAAMQAKLLTDTANQQMRYNPLLPELDDSALARAQVARDPTGTAAKLLAALNGSGVIASPATMRRNPDGVWAQPDNLVPLKGYHPEGGFGGVPDPEAIKSTLDPRIATHPVFQRLLQEHPDKAAFAYKAITGRDLEGDMKGQAATVANREKFQLGMASDLIKNGAYTDKATGRLMKWGYEMPPEGGVGSLTGGAQPVRKLMAATDDETEAYSRMYPRLMGHPDPIAPARAEASRGKGFEVRAAATLKDPAIAAAITAEESKLTRIAGHPITLTADEKLKVAQKEISRQGNAWSNPFKPSWSDIGQGMSYVGEKAKDQVVDFLDAMRYQNGGAPEVPWLGPVGR